MKFKRLTLSVFCFYLGVACGPGWFVCVCLLPSLAMLVGGVVCHPGAVLESGVSGVFPWVVSECECCVLLLEVCLSKL